MVSTRPANCNSSPLSLLFAAAIVVSISSCSSTVAPSNVRAEETKEKSSADTEYAVPEGTAPQIIAFVKKFIGQASQKKFTTREEYNDNQIKTCRMLVTAGDKILGQKCKDKDAAEGAQMKLSGLAMLAANHVGEASKEAFEAVSTLKSDSREDVSKIAKQFWIPIRIFNLTTMTDEERKSLKTEVVDEVKTKTFSSESVNAATQLGEALAMKFPDEAGQLYDELAKISAEATDPKFHPNADRFAALGRRATLSGKFLEIEGKTLDGKQFDWASYRGKVVLIDFWATWCAPCVAELPNVKANYKKYHDKGFDVVGISLDKVRPALEKFVDIEGIPWTQLYDEEVQRGEGWNHPMAIKYAISGIPVAILVDKEGKVVSMAARAEELSNLLEKMLGSEEPPQ